MYENTLSEVNKKESEDCWKTSDGELKKRINNFELQIQISL